jgi:hypothetical protein
LILVTLIAHEFIKLCIAIFPYWCRITIFIFLLFFFLFFEGVALLFIEADLKSCDKILVLHFHAPKIYVHESLSEGEL